MKFINYATLTKTCLKEKTLTKSLKFKIMLRINFSWTINVTMLMVILIMKNVLVQIHKFVFTTKFVIPRMEEDIKVPILHGIPFLATARTMIGGV